MLSSLAMPAVLVEIGNAQEPGFREKISDAEFQNTITSSIFAAIGKYYSSVGRELIHAQAHPIWFAGIYCPSAYSGGLLLF